MPASKISELPAASSAGDPDLLPLVQSGTTKKVTWQILSTAVLAGLGSSATLDAGTPSGVATLDGAGKLTSSQLPDLAISDMLGSAANQAAMLALVGQKGDWCVRSDTGTNWVITGNDPTQLGSWTQLSYPASPVTSVAGRTGAVTLSSNDVSGLGYFATGTSAANLSGNLPVSRLNGGTGASSTTFWRGDGTWAIPAGGTDILPLNNVFTGTNTFNNAVTIGASSSITLPQMATGTLRPLFRMPHNIAGPGGSPTTLVDFTTSFENAIFTGGDDLVFNSWQYNGNADSRGNPNVPAMSQNIEFSYAPGAGDLILEPHILKVNVGPAGSNIGVRADTWYIPSANTSSYSLQHLVTAHRHVFRGFNALSGGAVDENNETHAAFSFRRCEFLRNGKLVFDFFNNDITKGVQIGTNQADGMYFSTPKWSFTGLAYNRDVANGFEVNAGMYIRGGANVSGQPGRVAMESSAGTGYMLIANDRMYGDWNWGSGISRNGQIKIGIVRTTDKTDAGYRHCIYRSDNEGSRWRLYNQNDTGTEREIFQLPSTGLPVLAASPTIAEIRAHLVALGLAV